MLSLRLLRSVSNGLRVNLPFATHDGVNRLFFGRPSRPLGGLAGGLTLRHSTHFCLVLHLAILANVFNSGRLFYPLYLPHLGDFTRNSFGIFYLNQNLPFGGTKSSGYNRFGGPEGLRGLCNVKAVVVDRFGWLGVKTKIPRLVGEFQCPVSCVWIKRPGARKDREREQKATWLDWRVGR